MQIELYSGILFSGKSYHLIVSVDVPKQLPSPDRFTFQQISLEKAMLSTPCESVQILTDIPGCVENQLVIITVLKLKSVR